MAEHNCKECAFRKKHDNKPKSFLGRVWRWHINWCPGWKKYYNSLDEDQRNETAVKYNLK